MIQSLINLIFPKYCNVCREVLLKNENMICNSCIHDLPFTHLLEQQSSKLLLKFYGILEIENAFSIFYFHKIGVMQQLIHQLKYKNNQELGVVFGKYYATVIQKNQLHFQAIIPVPLHPKKLKERGYNQLTTFGKSMAQILDIPFIEDVLIRNTYNQTQTKKNRLQRIESLEKQKIFSIINQEKVTNKHVLLIDDVITTGATLIQCGKELKTIDGLKLSIVTICMAE
ncbi:MAG: ComF family protein [Flavobacterium sp.]